MKEVFYIFIIAFFAYSSLLSQESYNRIGEIDSGNNECLENGASLITKTFGTGNTDDMFDVTVYEVKYLNDTDGSYREGKSKVSVFWGGNGSFYWLLANVEVNRTCCGSEWVILDMSKSLLSKFRVNQTITISCNNQENFLRAIGTGIRPSKPFPRDN